MTVEELIKKLDYKLAVTEKLIKELDMGIGQLMYVTGEARDLMADVKKEVKENLKND